MDCTVNENEGEYMVENVSQANSKHSLTSMMSIPAVVDSVGFTLFLSIEQLYILVCYIVIAEAHLASS